MAFFDRFTKNNKDDIQYHAAAKVLINMCCDLEESKKFAKALHLKEDDFSDFHINKRNLACKTVLYTAAISMEPIKRDKFVKIFIERKKSHDDIDNAPPNIREMLIKMNNICDQAYHEAFTHVTNNLSRTQKDPVESLMDSFCRLFCSFLNQDGNLAYLEVGQEVFHHHHRITLHALKNL
jgi:hypothetical protein